LLDREQAAAWLRVSVRTLDTFRAKGMPVVMLGDSPRVEPEAALEWLRAGGAK
jgi:phage terminase Nu1 subunit (DNA packaging protein)